MRIICWNNTALNASNTSRNCVICRHSYHSFPHHQAIHRDAVVRWKPDETNTSHANRNSAPCRNNPPIYQTVIQSIAGTCWKSSQVDAPETTRRCIIHWHSCQSSHLRQNVHRNTVIRGNHHKTDAPDVCGICKFHRNSEAQNFSRAQWNHNVRWESR